MKTSRVIQFVAAAALFSAGCAGLYAGAYYGIGITCIVLSLFVPMRFSDIVRPIPDRQYGIDMLVYAVFVTLSVLARWFVPTTALVAVERVIFHPVFLAMLWAAFMVCLFRQWRKEGSRMN